MKEVIKVVAVILIIVSVIGLKIWANIAFEDGTCKACHEGKYQLVSVDRGWHYYVCDNCGDEWVS